MAPKETTIYDIAKHLNLSATTVSRGLRNHPAINKNTRKKIAEAARLLGYRSNTFASSLRSRRTNTIGIIVPRLSSHFMSSALAGMEDMASREGYNLIIMQSQEQADKERSNANILYNKRVDGLLVSLSYDTDSIQHFQPFLDRQIPVVFFDRTWPEAPTTCVQIDNARAASEVTKHLLEQGCRRILHLGGNLRRNVYSDRLRGYRQALLDYGLPYDEKLVRLSRLDEQAGAAAAQWLLQLKPGDRPDGIFSANDTAAVHCMMDLKAAGIDIPGEIAIAGFNNDPISKVIEPHLTTMNYPGFQVGETALMALLDHINGLPSARTTNTILLNSELMIRASSLKKG